MTGRTGRALRPSSDPPTPPGPPPSIMWSIPALVPEEEAESLEMEEKTEIVLERG